MTKKGNEPERATNLYLAPHWPTRQYPCRLWSEHQTYIILSARDACHGRYMVPGIQATRRCRSSLLFFLNVPCLLRVFAHALTRLCVYIFYVWCSCVLLSLFLFSDHVSQPNTANLRRDQGAAPGTPHEQAPLGFHGFPRPREAEDGGDVRQERERRRAGWVGFSFL